MLGKRCGLLGVGLLASFGLFGCGGGSSPLSVAVTATVKTVDGANTLTLTGTVTNDKNAAGVSWSLSGAGALSNTSTTSVTYTAPAATSVAQTATITATSVADSSQTGSITLTVAAKPTVATTSADLMGGVGTVFSITLQGSGGIAPYKNWAVSTSGSALPVCLTLNASTGVITTASGTAPTASCAGIYTNLIFTYTDSGTPTALTATSSALTLTITAAPAITFGAAPTATGTFNVAYTSAVAATGGAGTLTYAKASGTLPPDLTLSASGALTGTPKAADIGTWTFAVTASDAFGDSTTSANYTIVISYPALTVTTATLPSGYGNTAYSQPLAASGGNGGPYTWTVASGQASLTALNLSLSSSGVLSGTAPVAGGSASFTVKATDSASNSGTSSTIALTIKQGLSITTGTPLPTGYGNTAYSQTLAASGGTGTGLTWTVTSGQASLTALNLSLSSGGVLSGTPPVAGGSASSFGIKVTDSASNTATASLSLTIDTGVSVTAPTLAPAYPGGAYTSSPFTASGGSNAGFTWTMAAASGSSVPAGFSIVSGTGVISAANPVNTSSTSATYNVVITATDSLGNTGSANATITINGALSLPTPNPSSLPSGYAGVAYSGSVAGSGGSGNLAISVVSGLPTDNLSASATGGTLNIVSGVGGPTSATTVNFTVKLTDTTTTNSITQSYSISITTPTAVSLPSPNPVSLPSATQNQGYTGEIDASGGVPPYTWTINGTTVTSGGISVGSGLSASATGGSTLSISGTPSTTGTVTLTNVKVTDSLSTNATKTYTIQVNSAGQAVSGQVILTNNACNGGAQPTFSATIANVGGTTFTQTVQTDSSGNYSFSGVPNGTYTITPSISGAASSLFYPASYTGVVVNSSAVSGKDFVAGVGYTVSGTVTYSTSGAQTGQVYLALNNNNCGGNGGPGTSITNATLTSGGAFTIRGVPPGSYTLQAGMDPIGQGTQNTNDPTGNSSVTVTNAAVTNADVTIANPTYATPGSNPQIQVTANAGGVSIFYQPPTNSNGVEEANEYTVEWATVTGTDGDGKSICALGGGTGGAQFGTVAGSHTFTSIGNGTTLWILNNTVAGANTFTSGTGYCFQARSFNTLASTTHPSGWADFNTDSLGNPQPVTIGPASCTGTCTTVSGAVTIPAGVTITSGAPLYLGLFQNTNSGPPNIYAAEIASPIVGANAYTISVPSGSGYVVFGTLDQNKNGEIDAGDVTNARNNNSNGVTVSGSTMTGQDVTLPSANSTASVTTQYNSTTSAGGTSTSYQLNLEVDEANKLPVAVTLTSGPNLINPVDMSLCTQCGNLKYQYSATLPGNTPSVGDAYDFTVTYSDGSQDTGTTVNGAVTAFGSTGAIVGAADLATGLSPSVTGSTTPTFTWTDPSGASSYTYQFYIADNSGNTIWQIPGNNSNSNGFGSSITSLTWGTDPTDGSNSPSGSLTGGTTYNWQIQVQDSNGNSAQTVMYFIP